MTKEEKKAELIAAINQIPLDPNFELPSGFPVPLKNRMFVKQVTDTQGMEVTEGGIIIPQNMAKNSVIPNVAVIYALGLDCSEYLCPGLRIIYNPFCEQTVVIKGKHYLDLNEGTDIFGILPPDTWVHPGVKSEAHLRRENRRDGEAAYEIRKSAKDANDTDKRVEGEKILIKSLKAKGKA